MINPFDIKINTRFTFNDRTIIIYSFNLLSVKWYYLDTWWVNQKKLPDLNKTNMLGFIIKTKKYKFK